MKKIVKFLEVKRRNLKLSKRLSLVIGSTFYKDEVFAFDLSIGGAFTNECFTIGVTLLIIHFDLEYSRKSQI